MTPVDLELELESPESQSDELDPLDYARAVASVIAVVLCAGLLVAFTGLATDPAASGTGEGSDGAVSAEQFAALRQATPPVGITPHKQRMELTTATGSSTMTFVFDAQGNGSGELRLPGHTPVAIVGSANTIYLPTLDRAAWQAFVLTDAERMAAVVGDDLLGYLRHLSGPHEVREAGREQVRGGVLATRFHAEIPFEAVLQPLVDSGIVDEGTAAMLEQTDLDATGTDATGTGISSIEFDVWLDDASNLRQVRSRVEVGPTTSESLLEIYDLGEPNVVQLPDPTQVAGRQESSVFDPAGPYLTHLRLLLELP